MSMGTRLYLLLGGDGDETKVWYPLNFDTWMMKFWENRYEIVKLVPIPTRCHSYSEHWLQIKVEHVIRKKKP